MPDHTPSERLIAMFAERWQAQGGMLYRLAAGQSWASVLREVWDTLIADTAPKGSVVYWVNADLAHLPWEEWLRGAGAEGADMWDATRDMRAVCAQAAVGLTGAQWAVAETGTVALVAAHERGLLPSVMPPVHVMLVAVHQLVETVAEGLQRVSWRGGMPPLIKLVTGPSMTADIEGTLVIGVHGPGRVGVILYD